MANYEVTGSSVAYDGKIMRVVVDEIFYVGAGKASKREVVVKDDFVMVVPLAEDGKVVCVQQYRHPFREQAISFPAGRVDAGESPDAAARRELEEEAGLRAGRLVKIAELREVPEFARSTGHLFFAEQLTPSAASGAGGSKASRDPGEAGMEVLRHDERELRLMVRTGKIKSTTVIAALHHFLDFRERSRLTFNRQEEYVSPLCPLSRYVSLSSSIGVVFWAASLGAAAVAGALLSQRRLRV
eukprot:TRINITY_DN24389_c0_g1_i1.p1 TRINITY_DN24389_c0_g1~~TRINITY_DN24389_c0_g1_i1.p1  ORF type:complete len:242 (-),score=66.09 TRINITY_DN24389_c0_g1_i1:64-789(-)